MAKTTIRKTAGAVKKSKSAPVKKTSASRNGATKAVALSKAGHKIAKKAPPLPVGKKKIKSVRPLPAASPVVTAKAAGTNGKPAKNQAGLKAHDVEVFRNLLLEKRRELVGDMGQMEREALQRGGGSNLSNLPIHMADMGTDNYEQEFTLGLMEKDRNLLRDINQALGRIQDGSYGICEATGKTISRARLEAQPWARYSIEYARKMEKRLGR